jgi:hypothetical protein
VLHHRAWKRVLASIAPEAPVTQSPLEQCFRVDGADHPQDQRMKVLVQFQQFADLCRNRPSLLFPARLPGDCNNIHEPILA